MSLSQNGALTRYFYVYGRHGLGNILLAGGLYSVGVLLVGTAISWLLHSELLFYCFLLPFANLDSKPTGTAAMPKTPVYYLTIQLGSLGQFTMDGADFQFCWRYHGQSCPSVLLRLSWRMGLLCGGVGVGKYQFAIKFRFTQNGSNWDLAIF